MSGEGKEDTGRGGRNKRGKRKREEGERVGRMDKVEGRVGGGKGKRKG